MRPEPGHAPEGARARRRRRRLAFLLLLAPGPILVVIAVNVWGNPWLLLCGLVWSGLVLARAWARQGPVRQAPPANLIAPEIEP